MHCKIYTTKHLPIKIFERVKLIQQKNFRALKSDLPIYKLHKIFTGLTDSLNVVGSSYELRKILSFGKLSVTLLANSRNFVKLLPNSTKFVKLFSNFRNFMKGFPTSINFWQLFAGLISRLFEKTCT